VEAWQQHGLGAALAVAGWLLTRHSAAAAFRRPAAVALDALWPAIGYGVLLAASARPILSGIVVLFLGAGLMLADRTKRAALREPVVFSDMDEFFQLFRHPQLYLPFAGTGRVIIGALAALGAFAALLAIEPPVWRWTPWLGILAAGTLCALSFAVMQAPLLEPIAGALKRFGLSGDPTQDANALGLLAAQFTYGMIARAERSARRAMASPSTRPGGETRPGNARHPIVLIQSESFFDARRLHSAIPRDLLPSFDACCRTALQCGRLAVPGWGANTMRTEFAALTGLTEVDLGFDRFNPYHAFARKPVSSLAWQLRSRGYRTICLHPFDRRFFRRDRAMPNLGFDAFIGPEAFVGAARTGLYVTDVEVGHRVLDLVASEGPKLFVFAITMENHGPWLDPTVDTTSVPDGLAEIKQAAALRQYLAGLRNADRMLELLIGAFGGGRPALVGFYGDHLPSLPQVFDSMGFEDPRTDYVIWRGDGGPPQRQDLAAHELPRAMLGSVGL
jgi:hypothetical protein